MTLPFSRTDYTVFSTKMVMDKDKNCMTLRYNQGDHWCVVTVMLDKEQIPIGKKLIMGFRGTQSN